MPPLPNTLSTATTENGQKRSASDVRFSLASATQAEKNGWNDLVLRSPYGHYPQTTWWALGRGCAPSSQNFILMQQGKENRLIGGVHIRRPRPMLGLIDKGPVVASREDSPMIEPLISSVVQMMHRLKVLAVVCRPPESGTNLNSVLRDANFAPFSQRKLHAATIQCDVSGSSEDMQARIPRKIRQKLRESYCSDLVIREGNEKDLGTFFSLMQQSCLRQNSKPSPASLGDLQQMWSALAAKQSVHLLFAEYKGVAEAAQLSILFHGSEYERKIWITAKKGWNGAEPKSERHVNIRLIGEVMNIANQRGFSLVDMGGCDAQIAALKLNGEALPPDLASSYDHFKTNFGGKPILFSEPQIYFQYKWMRAAYRNALSLPLICKLLQIHPLDDISMPPIPVPAQA